MHFIMDSPTVPLESAHYKIARCCRPAGFLFCATRKAIRSIGHPRTTSQFRVLPPLYISIAGICRHSLWECVLGMVTISFIPTMKSLARSSIGNLIGPAKGPRAVAYASLWKTKQLEPGSGLESPAQCPAELDLVYSRSHSAVIV